MDVVPGANMSKYIITRNAWGDGMKAKSSIVPELILPFEGLKEKCRSLDVEFITLPEWKEGMEVICAFFIDCPAPDDPLVKMWVHRNIPNMLLMIAENLYLQPNHTYEAVGKFADKIFSYEDNPPFPNKTVRLNYPVDLENGLKWREKALAGDRPYLAGMIASMKQSNMPGSLYAKRAEYAFNFSYHAEDRFALYGPDWGQGFGGSVKGFLPTGLTSKHDALSQCEFAICMENNNSIPGYVTEKLFNALIAGCIPIYEYCDNGQIPRDCYIDASKFDYPIECLDYIEAMTTEQKDAMRCAGLAFLQGSASAFSSESYIQTLYDEIELIA